MPENDTSRPIEDDSGRKTTCHVEMISPRAAFLLSPQSSALITYEAKP